MGECIWEFRLTVHRYTGSDDWCFAGLAWPGNHGFGLAWSSSGLEFLKPEPGPVILAWSGLALAQAMASRQKRVLTIDFCEVETHKSIVQPAIFTSIQFCRPKAVGPVGRNCCGLMDLLAEHHKMALQGSSEYGMACTHSSPGLLAWLWLEIFQARSQGQLKPRPRGGLACQSHGLAGLASGLKPEPAKH
ncbi:hypothetical protein DFH09DRAFT_1067542 [Mycena vulgaris]|nr:hypothetical protein DFH09DRAFT_1067542 [Mycena vulgaris]